MQIAPMTAASAAEAATAMTNAAGIAQALSGPTQRDCMNRPKA